MEKLFLFLAILVSMALTPSDSKDLSQKDEIHSQETPSTSCGENCQLPAEPDDDEGED
ncbi:hypothetical protein [Polaribacter sp.]|uniref:hypothetical protein n=1 Tax=Polaribacter sp. TaxID=1920175 RepID=UPI003F6BAAFA